MRGAAAANRGFATLSAKGVYSFYRVNLTTGRAVRVGAFSDAVVDVAIPLNQ
jgi:hypothetical protein